MTKTDTLEEWPLEAGFKLNSDLGEVDNDTDILGTRLPEYTVTYKNRATVLSEDQVERVRNEFDVDVTKTAQTELGDPTPDTETTRERLKDFFDFDKLRLQVEVKYRGFAHDSKEEIKVLDRVVPVYYGLNSSTLVDSGVEYDDYIDGSTTSIEWKLMMKVARGETDSDDPGHS